MSKERLKECATMFWSAKEELILVTGEVPCLEWLPIQKETTINFY